MTATADIVRRRGIEASPPGSGKRSSGPRCRGDRKLADHRPAQAKGGRSLARRRSQFPESKLDDKLIAAGTSFAYANFHGHLLTSITPARSAAQEVLEIPF